LGLLPLLEQLKRLGGDSLLYALMNVGTKLIAFFMLPIYTYYLGPKEMGVFENIDAVTSMLTFVIIFGTDNALAYYFFNTKDETEKNKYVKNVLTFRLYIALCFLAIFIIFSNELSQIILGVSGYYHLFYFSGVILVLESVITVILTVYRFQFKSTRVVILTVGKLGLVALLSYLFFKFLHLKVDSIYLSRLVSAVIIIVTILVPIFRFLNFKIDFEVLKKLLIYGAPLVPASIAFWVISFSNRFFLTQFESLESAGIYGVAVKFATMISLLTSSVQMAWRPYSLSIKDRPDAKKIYSNIFYIILVVGIFGLLGIATITPFILDMLIPDPAYKEAGKYIAMLSLGSFLSFYYLIISVGLFLEKKTPSIAIYVGLSAVISLILNIALIPYFSIWGAVTALIISYIFVNVMIFIKSQKVYYIPVSPLKLVSLFLSGGLSILSIVYIYEYSTLDKFFVVIPWIFMIVVTFITGIWKSFFLKKAG
jgi:O-antigen/teichoic acid export membrane protein